MLIYTKVFVNLSRIIQNLYHIKLALFFLNIIHEPLMQQDRFKLIRNCLQTDNIEHIKELIVLKCLYSKQLSRMPRQYLVKLLFDTYHSSIILKINNTIKAGITFRSFKNKNFFEIAFLAVNNQNQCQGLGSELMNEFKKYCQEQKIQYLFTFADDGAIGFFQKHGFSTKITLPKEYYKKFIKQYIGGKLMLCKIHPSINYKSLKQGIEHIKNIIFEKLKQQTICQTQYDMKKSSKMIRSQSQANQLLSDLATYIPGLPEAGFKKQSFCGQEKKLSLPFLLYCQNFIELAARKSDSLDQGQLQKETKQLNLKQIQTQKPNRKKKYLKLLKNIQLKLSQGYFRYKDQFIEEFSKNLKIIFAPQQILSKSQKQFLIKIQRLKYDFMKNILELQTKEKKTKN